MARKKQAQAYGFPVSEPVPVEHRASHAQAQAVHRRVAEARTEIIQAGITPKLLAKTTGTTKGEVRGMIGQAARKLAKGGVQRSDTAALTKALSGGPAAGIARTPNQVRFARTATTAVRKAVKQDQPRQQKKKPSGGGGRSYT